MTNEQEGYKKLKGALVEDRAIAFRSVFKSITGSYCAALVLAQLIYWHPKASSEWIYKTDTDLGEEICASEDELQTARARLSKLGFVETKRIGLPAKMHYRINFDAILAAICPESGEETTPEEPAQVPGVVRNLFPGITGTSSGGHSATCSGQPPELSYTEITTEMTTSDGADAHAQAPAGRSERDPLDTLAAWEASKAAARAAGRDNAPAAHRLAGRWPHLVAHCRAFEDASGLRAADVPASKLPLWAKDLEGHAGAGLTPDDERTLVNLARSKKFDIYRPGSLDNLIAVMRKGAAGAERPRYKTLAN